ncbi:hypothetical protein N7457_009175 [Penicillium paradoxum]|uniref:uncharacterized protein n=1 Tax=Penicillium paradoxum TaxID=176176 RepID=UPI002548CFE7|nr:uncharacterized protein N7457_009175 [Penicillium paradoxum]KAJ5774279.1 hypothetical protein N7457_009175 [Penicillium paradoxum]
MGLPIFGTSNYTTPQWTHDPPTRGTSGLLLSCLTTLVLCVYSALHLNVFDRQCEWWMRCLIKTKWVLIALLAPEFVVYNAWSQRRQALRIAQLLRRRSGQHEPETFLVRLRKGLGMREELDQETGTKGDVTSSDDDSVKVRQIRLTIGHSNCVKDPSSSQTFDLSHGFLVVMGGLVVDMSRDTERVWPMWCDSLTITPACVEECFGLDLFDDIDFQFLSKEAIAGRSKRDYFTKFITSIQVVWFSAQFFIRLNESLPISLLELNTFAHSICALAIYLLWWHKPTDIDDPFVLHTEQSEALRDVCAAQWTLGASGKHYKKQCLYRSEELAVTLRSRWESISTHAGSELLMIIFRGRSGITLLPGTGEDWYIFRQTEENRWLHFPRYQSRKRFKIRVNDDRPIAMKLEAGQRIPGTREHVDSQFQCVEVDDITLTRWNRALRTRHFICNYSVWFRDRQPNFVWPRGLDSKNGSVIADELLKGLFASLVTSLCYGGLHMLAWDSAALDKTGLAETFWKLSCLNLVVFGPLGFVIWAGLKVWRGPDAHLTLSLGWSVLLMIITALAFVAYATARMYLVVEVFVMIPYMDPAVYKLPEYAAYWPHFV